MLKLYTFKDSNGSIIGQYNIGENDPDSYIGQEYDGVVVAELVDEDAPRQERLDVFAKTIDRMSPLWYNSLTQQQQEDLATWRQAWLDYPETGIRPDDLSWLFT